MSHLSDKFQILKERLQKMQEKLYEQPPSFYDLVAGGMIGGGIEGAARALEELGTKGAYNLSARIAGVLLLIIAGGFLVRIARIVESIERPFIASSKTITTAHFKAGKTEIEIDNALRKFRLHLRLRKDPHFIVISSFRLASFLTIMSFIFFVVAGLLDPDVNYIAITWQWCAQTSQTLLQILKHR